MFSILVRCRSLKLKLKLCRDIGTSSRRMNMELALQSEVCLELWKLLEGMVINEIFWSYFCTHKTSTKFCFILLTVWIVGTKKRTDCILLSGSSALFLKQSFFLQNYSKKRCVLLSWNVFVRIFESCPRFFQKGDKYVLFFAHSSSPSTVLVCKTSERNVCKSSVVAEGFYYFPVRFRKTEWCRQTIDASYFIERWKKDKMCRVFVTRIVLHSWL